jgi:hypothetical protein
MGGRAFHGYHCLQRRRGPLGGVQRLALDFLARDVKKFRHFAGMRGRHDLARVPTGQRAGIERGKSGRIKNEGRRFHTLQQLQRQLRHGRLVHHARADQHRVGARCKFGQARCIRGIDAAGRRFAAPDHHRLRHCHRKVGGGRLARCDLKYARACAQYA